MTYQYIVSNSDGKFLRMRSWDVVSTAEKDTLIDSYFIDDKNSASLFELDTAEKLVRRLIKIFQNEELTIRRVC